MKALMYRGNVFDRDFICAAYENSENSVNISYLNYELFNLQWAPGAVVYESKTGNINEYVKKFGPYDVQQSTNDVGKIVQNVWRPGLNLDYRKALEIDSGDESRAKKELKLLISKLEEIFLYIEPDTRSIDLCYGHKTRELLILACTELENRWIHYMRLSNKGGADERYTTSDYVKLYDKLFLSEFKVTFTNHPFVSNIIPFSGWNQARPTQSLKFYDAYNKLKHNGYDNFEEAKLSYCIEAVSANIIMHCIRYSPYSIIEGSDSCSIICNEFFSISLENPSLKNFYIPFLKKVEMATGAFSAPLGSCFEKLWEIESFAL